MPIQFQTFTPLVHPHYTMAETQSEKEAENARNMRRDAANNTAKLTQNMAQEDSATQRAAMANEQRQRELQTNQAQQNYELGLTTNRQAQQDKQAAEQQQFANQNSVSQQGLAQQNKIADRQVTVDQNKTQNEALAQERGLIGQDRSARASREIEAASRDKTTFEQQQTAQQRQLDNQNQYQALAKLSYSMANAPADANGNRDITGQKAALAVMGVNVDHLNDFTNILSKEVNGKQVLSGVNAKGETVPLMYGNAPVVLGNDAVSSMAKIMGVQAGYKPETGSYEPVKETSYNTNTMANDTKITGILDKQTGRITPAPPTPAQQEASDLANKITIAKTTPPATGLPQPKAGAGAEAIKQATQNVTPPAPLAAGLQAPPKVAAKEQIPPPPPNSGYTPDEWAKLSLAKQQAVMGLNEYGEPMVNGEMTGGDGGESFSGGD